MILSWHLLRLQTRVRLLSTAAAQSSGGGSVWAGESLAKVLERFDAPIRFAAGYGSGVLRQEGYARSSAPMVDLIFAVTHSEHWHSLNLRQHPSHYSFVGKFGAKAVSDLQEKFGAAMYFNTDIIVDGMRIKYGVISVKHLLQDLNDWSSFYVAGRLQKPIRILRGDSRVKLANEQNLLNALRVALLLLPETFTEYQLYSAIVGLSYLGDFRMIYGENPKKIENIVNAQQEHLRALYWPFIERLVKDQVLSPVPDPFKAGSSVSSVEVHISQNFDTRARGSLLFELPNNVRDKVLATYHKQKSLDPIVPSTLDLSQRAASEPNISVIVKKAISDTVRIPALTQSIKGLVTAGPSKSLRYVGEKLSKR